MRLTDNTKVEYYNYIKRKKNLLADSQKGYVPFFDVYGPNGKMPQRLSDNAAEYDKVKIDIPEGMTEEMFTAIILGFAMDPNEISKYIEGNEIIGVSEIENYQMHMVHHSNILGGDHRDSFLAPHLFCLLFPHLCLFSLFENKLFLVFSLFVCFSYVT